MTWEGGEPVIGPLYSPELEELFGLARKKHEGITQFHKDLASSVQMIYEEFLLWRKCFRSKRRKGIRFLPLSMLTVPDVFF